MQCSESLRLQAYFDGELDASSAAAMEGHLEHCAECRALLGDLERLRTALRDDVEHPRAPAALRERVLESLEREGSAQRAAVAAQGQPGAAAEPVRLRARSPERPRRSFFLGAASGAFGMALAATIAFVVVLTPAVPPVVDELVSAHIRSLMPSHLIDVVSTDQHTVKPWFSGHADVSPVVANFAESGYTLVGGRADYFERQRAAVVVYQHGAHVINVFVWAWDGQRVPKTSSRNGYHLQFWRSGNLVYCAVSDAGWSEIEALVERLQGLGARDTRG